MLGFYLITINHAIRDELVSSMFDIAQNWLINLTYDWMSRYPVNILPNVITQWHSYTDKHHTCCKCIINMWRQQWCGRSNPTLTNGLSRVQLHFGKPWNVKVILGSTDYFQFVEQNPLFFRHQQEVVQIIWQQKLSKKSSRKKTVNICYTHDIWGIYFATCFGTEGFL